MDNATRRQLLQKHKMSGFPGSIMKVFQAHEQGVDLIDQFQQQQMQVAKTPQERQQGLRPAHQSGNTDASMAFPDTPPNASFNTMGMKSPIDVKQYDDSGNLVKSYDSVPPGVTDLKMSSQGGTVIETPSQMQSGGFAAQDNTRVATALPPQQHYQLNSLPQTLYRDQGTIRQTPNSQVYDRWRDKDSLLENSVEFFDPTGVSSWDDARRAYESMKNRGASIPNLDEGLDMFGAIPLFGKAKLGINLAKGAAKRSKDVVNAAKKGYNYLTKGSDVINRVDAIEDEVGFLDQKQFGGVKKYQTGGQVDTLYVNTPDHPRIQQYADSSYAYNMGLQGQAKAVAESQKLLDEYNNRNKFTGSHKAFGQTSSINTNTSNTIKGLQPSSTQKINYMAPAPYDPSINVPVKIPVPGPNTFQSGIVYSLWDKPKQPVVYRPELQQMDKINPSAISQSTPNASLKPVGKYINSTRPPQTMYKQDPSVSTGQYPIGEYLWDSNSRRWKTDTWDTEMQKASRELAIPRGYKLGGIKRK